VASIHSESNENLEENVLAAVEGTNYLASINEKEQTSNVPHTESEEHLKKMIWLKLK
jgi:hypothetical protein